MPVELAYTKGVVIPPNSSLPLAEAIPPYCLPRRRRLFEARLTVLREGNWNWNL